MWVYLGHERVVIVGSSSARLVHLFRRHRVVLSLIHAIQQIIFDYQLGQNEEVGRSRYGQNPVDLIGRQRAMIYRKPSSGLWNFIGEQIIYMSRGVKKKLFMLCTTFDRS